MPPPGIVGVTPGNAPGTYNAQLRNGQNMLLTGPAGQSLFDRYKNIAGQALTGTLGALPGVGPAIGALAGGARLASGNDDLGPATPPPAPGPAVQAPAIRGAVPASTQAGPAAAPQEQPPPQSGPTPLGYTMGAVDPSTGKEVQGQAVLKPDGSIGVYVPPRAGSPGGLTSRGKDAIAASNKMEQQVAEARAAETQAREEGVRLAQEDAQRQQAFHQEQQRQIAVTVKDQQDENAAIAERVAERQARYDDLRAKAMAGKVDENQYMKGATGVFSALGAALGAWGAALARTPNFAGEFVQSQIERNIRRQEAEIAIKGKDADNALGDLIREGGTLKDGKAMLRQLLTERAAIEANVVASTAKDQQIGARAKEIAAQLAGQAAIQDKTRRQGDLEHVMTSRLYNAPGSAGTTGGFLSPTLEGRQAAQNLTKGAQSIKQTEQEMALASKKAADQKGRGPAGQLGAAAAAQIAQIESALAGLQEYKQLHDELGKPGVLVRGGKFASEASQKLAGKAGALAPVVSKALAGDAATTGELESNKDDLLNSSGPQISESIDAKARQLILRREAILANPGAPPPAPGTQ